MADSHTPVLLSSEMTVPTAGTAVALGPSRRIRTMTIVAKVANTNNVYVGGSDVSSSTNGGMAPGDVLTVTPQLGGFQDLADYFIDVDTNGEGVDLYIEKG